MEPAIKTLGPAATSDRLVAAVIDWVICVGASYPLGIVSYLLMVRLLGLGWWACFGAVAITPLAYFTWGWARGATLGMKAMQLRMERPSGGAPGPARAFARSVCVYPFGVGSSAFGVAVYGHLVGMYPSGAEPATSGLRFLLLGMATGSYVLVVFAARWRSDGRSIHDLAANVVVLGPVWRRAPVGEHRKPLKRISAWFLVAVPPALLIGVVWAVVLVELLVEGAAGEAAVTAAPTFALFYGSYEALRRTLHWRRSALGIPYPTWFGQGPQRYSRWLLLLAPPVLAISGLTFAAMISLLVEGDPAAATICGTLAIASAYGLWELLRRTIPLPRWAGGPPPPSSLLPPPSITR